MDELSGEESVISTVFTPIFFSAEASVTETEREKGGRTEATEPAKEGGTRVWKNIHTRERF